MKKFIAYFSPVILLLALAFMPLSTIQAQGIETFEAPLAVGSTSFTNAGLTFTSSAEVPVPGTPNAFDTNEFEDAGASGSDRYLDNFGTTFTSSTYSISITGGATLFTMQSMEIYISSSATGANPTADGTLVITGKSAGAMVFTDTKTTGFPTTFGATGGFFLLDFSALPTIGDESGSNIDEIELTLTGGISIYSSR